MKSGSKRKLVRSLVVAASLASSMTVGGSTPAAAHIQTPTDYCSYAPDYVPGLYDFRHACAHHDYAYRTHWVSRATADTYFRWAMESECRNRHPWYSSNLGKCLAVKEVYYFFVRRFGQSAYDRWETTAAMGPR
ncbi:MAG TPA: phospholipase A2 [Actinomycetota bacterium]|nr:phospholipase A2 [Actinomycetota bacterium]